MLRQVQVCRPSFGPASLELVADDCARVNGDTATTADRRAKRSTVRQRMFKGENNHEAKFRTGGSKRRLEKFYAANKGGWQMCIVSRVLSSPASQLLSHGRINFTANIDQLMTP